MAFLIGRNGVAVSDMQNKTNARINVARSGADVPAHDQALPGTRRITISGHPEAVELALNLVYYRLSGYRGGGHYTWLLAPTGDWEATGPHYPGLANPLASVGVSSSVAPPSSMGVGTGMGMAAASGPSRGGGGFPSMGSSSSAPTGRQHG